ncbi:MAG: hypothetical protein NT150_13985 [Bacteroidetes bacterium]|nr:hypothetical protein [Bacteroidota bacterium]
MKPVDLEKMSNAIDRIDVHLELEDFCDVECILPNGQKVLMQSPDKSIFFAFSREEFSQLKELVENAVIMMEVRKSLSN